MFRSVGFQEEKLIYSEQAAYNQLTNNGQQCNNSGFCLRRVLCSFMEGILLISTVHINGSFQLKWVEAYHTGCGNFFLKQCQLPLSPFPFVLCPVICHT